MGLIRHIRAGKMGKDTLYIQIWQMADLFDRIHRSIIRQKTDTAHPRIKGNMYIDLLSRFLSRRIKVFCHLQRKNGGHDMVCDHCIILLFACISQNQDRLFYTRLPQFNTLVDRSHRKPIRAAILHGFRHSHRAMSVGVCFDHTHQFCLNCQFTPDIFYILTQRVQIYAGTDPVQAAFFLLIHIILPQSSILFVTWASPSNRSLADML